jgi:hypothetical protein
MVRMARWICVPLNVAAAWVGVPVPNPAGRDKHPNAAGHGGIDSEKAKDVPPFACDDGKQKPSLPSAREPDRGFPNPIGHP